MSRRFHLAIRHHLPELDERLVGLCQLHAIDLKELERSDFLNRCQTDSVKLRSGILPQRLVSAVLAQHCEPLLSFRFQGHQRCL